MALNRPSGLGALTAACVQNGDVEQQRHYERTTSVKPAHSNGNAALPCSLVPNAFPELISLLFARTLRKTVSTQWFENLARHSG
jgi:hypothetical protein